jgi:hypothetical protein
MSKSRVFRKTHCFHSLSNYVPTPCSLPKSMDKSSFVPSSSQQSTSQIQQSILPSHGQKNSHSFSKVNRQILNTESSPLTPSLPHLIRSPLKIRSRHRLSSCQMGQPATTTAQEEPAAYSAQTETSTAPPHRQPQTTSRSARASPAPTGFPPAFHKDVVHCRAVQGWFRCLQPDELFQLWAGVINRHEALMRVVADFDVSTQFL